MQFLTKEQELKIVELYENGESSTKIMQLFHLPYLNKVTNIVKKYGKSVRRVGTPTIVSYDVDKFMNPTNEDYYWLGFLLADGALHKNKSSTYLSIGLSRSDKEHLIKYQNWFNIKNTEVYDRINHANNIQFETCKITIGINNSVENSLKNYGIIERKSLIDFCPNIEMSKNEIKHFIRGYFDGDGCITMTIPKNKKTYRPMISFVGTNTLLSWIKNQLEENLKSLRSNNILLVNGQYKYGWGSIESTKELYNYMYTDAINYLDRKKLKFEEFFNLRNIPKDIV